MTQRIKRRTPRQAMNHWIKALKSGQYEQTGDQLGAGDDKSFCCLGVLCDLAGRDGGPQWGDKLPNELLRSSDDQTSGYLEESDGLPPRYMTKFFGLHAKEVGKLARMNDNGKSFKQIADWLEARKDKILARVGA